MARRGRKGGVSLAKGPVGLLGLASLAYGVLGLVFGGQSFTSSPMDGTVNGETFLGLEGNGWTNLLFIAAGGLLAFGAPLHWGAKTMALIVGLGLGAASVISLVDGEDGFGIFAANGLTKLVWGAGSVVLLILALLPRVGGRKVEPAEDRRAADEPAGRRFDRGRERDVEPVGRRPRGRDREVVAPADGDGPRDHGRNRI